MRYLRILKLVAAPKSTLNDYVTQYDKTSKQIIDVRIGRKPTLSGENDLMSFAD